MTPLCVAATANSSNTLKEESTSAYRKGGGGDVFVTIIGVKAQGESRRAGANLRTGKGEGNCQKGDVIIWGKIKLFKELLVCRCLSIQPNPMRHGSPLLCRQLGREEFHEVQQGRQPMGPHRAGAECMGENFQHNLPFLSI